MDIRQLETYVEVVRCKNFSKAADKLFLTQPTVSSHVNALEEEFNTKLISRTTKDFRITEAGEKLYSFAVRILRIKDKITESLVGDREDILKIGVSSAVSLGYLPEIISGFHKIRPEIKFEVINLDSLSIIKKVDEGSLEIGLVGNSTPDYDLDFIEFSKDELVVVMPNTQKYIEMLETYSPIEIVFKELFIMRGDNSGTKKEIVRYFAEKGLNIDDLNLIATMKDSVSIVESVKNGLGVSILSKKVVDALNEAGKLLTFPLGSGVYTRKFYIVSSKEQYMSPLVREFLYFIKKLYKLKCK